jgi:hypothetical protein
VEVILVDVCFGGLRRHESHATPQGAAYLSE